LESKAHTAKAGGGGIREKLITRVNLYEASLIPRNSLDGRAINLKRLVEFLKIAYPWMANVQEILDLFAS